MSIRSSLVLVLRRNGSVRLSADFKTIINNYIKNLITLLSEGKPILKMTSGKNGFFSCLILILKLITNLQIKTYKKKLYIK